MKNIKFGVFFLGLAVAIGGAISLAAQDRSERPRPNVMVLDGRGAQLGVMVSDVDAKEPLGVRVDDVNPDSPAERAGLREGDVVVEYDGERVRSARQFTRLVQETPDGRTVKIAVMRNGQKQTLDATPENRVASSFDLGIDPDRLRDDFERGLRGFRVEPPQFDFRFDDRAPRRFEYRVPEMVMPFMGSRARLGVTVQSLTRDLEEYFGAKNGGVLVSSVARDSAASKAGLQAGDVITAINGRSVTDQGELMRELSDAGGEVTLTILRDKQEMTLKATLEAPERPRNRGSRPGIVM
ncbi:MAG TPA: PDZ domain-containing protein [Vicinamibacterales bacterium]|nr:PDZ domain-containing protein [Vicinamibacterales bacterium]